MATVTTSEFVKTREPVASFSMIEHKGIFARLVEEGSLAIGDFTRDPRGFLREIFSNEAKDAQRSKRLRMGLAFGLAFQIVAITAIAIAGWHHATTTSKAEAPEFGPVRILNFDPKIPTENLTNATTKGDAPGKISDPSKGSPDAGSQSGGGGQENPVPAQQGIKPPSLPNPAVISPTAPIAHNPSLPMNYTIQGIETPPLSPDAKIGVRDGAPNTNSAGPGKNGGIGESDGPGIGNKTGPGGGDIPGGAGPNGGTKGEPLDSTGGITPAGPIDYRLLAKIPDSKGIVWIHRVRPIITPEAQADKVVGYVLLEANFNADGTITNIRVKQSLGVMDEAAIESLRKAKFSPATKKGVPITLLRVPIKVNVNMS